MPTLPRYESQRSLTTQQPSPLAPESTEGKRMGLAAEAVGVAGDAFMKWNKANASMQKTQAELNMKTQLLDINARAAVDPDKNAYDKYAAEIDKVYAGSTNGFSDPEVSAQARMQFDYEAKAAKININGMFRKKQIESDQVNVKQQIDMLVQNPSEDSMDQIRQILKQKVEVGIFGEDAAYVMEQKAEKDVKFNMFTADLMNDPEGADQKLKDNAYKFDISELEKARTIQDKSMKRRKEVYEENFFNSSVDAGLKLVEGKLSQTDIQDMVMSGDLDPEVAGAYEIALFSPKWGNFEDDNAKKIGMSAQFLMGVVDKMEKYDPVTAQTVIKDALNAYNKSPQMVNETDLTFIFRTIDQKRKGPEDPMWPKLWSSMKWLGGLPVADAAVNLFTKEWDGKGDPEVVAQRVAQEATVQASTGNKFEVGKRYKWGEYLGVNAETGKKMFKK